MPHVWKKSEILSVKNNLSMKELADLVQLSPMSISNYEKEERRPDMQTIKALAKALHVRVIDFLDNLDSELVFCHGEFRKNSKLPARQQELVREEVEEYFGRFYQVIQILGGEVIPVFSKIHVLKLGESEEENALRMREHLELPKKQDGGSMNQARYREKSRDYFISWCTAL